MAQGRFVAKLVLSCACAKCTSLGGRQRVRGSMYGADTDATYADDGPRPAEGLGGAHEGRVVAVERKDGEFSVGVERAGDGGGERGIEGAARLGAERDVCLERFAPAEHVSYSTCRALGRKEENDETDTIDGEASGCAPRCPRRSRLRWRS